MEKKFIAVQSLNGSKGAYCFWGYIDDRGWVSEENRGFGETPIEDYGMFMVLDEEIDPKSAQRIFSALLGHAEGEEPEVVEEITYDTSLFRPFYLPTALTPKQFEVYSYLIENSEN